MILHDPTCSSFELVVACVSVNTHLSFFFVEFVTCCLKEKNTFGHGLVFLTHSHLVHAPVATLYDGRSRAALGRRRWLDPQRSCVFSLLAHEAQTGAWFRRRLELREEKIDVAGKRFP